MLKEWCSRQVFTRIALSFGPSRRNLAYGAKPTDFLAHQYLSHDSSSVSLPSSAGQALEPSMAAMATLGAVIDEVLRLRENQSLAAIELQAVVASHWFSPMVPGASGRSSSQGVGQTQPPSNLTLDRPRPVDLTVTTGQLRKLVVEAQYENGFHVELSKQIAFVFVLLREKAPEVINGLFFLPQDVAPRSGLECEGKEVLDAILAALRVPERCTTASSILRVCLAMPDCLRLLTDINLSWNAATFEDSVVGQIATNLGSGDSCLATAAWLPFQEIFVTEWDLKLKQRVAEFATRHSTALLRLIVNCVKGVSYVAKRQTLKLLTVLLTERAYLPLRRKYVQSPALLCALLQCLNDRSNHIQYEAYHSLKVFVANPNKTIAIRSILLGNRDVLTLYLATYDSGDPDVDEQLRQERDLLLKVLSSIQPLDQEEEFMAENIKTKPLTTSDSPNARTTSVPSAESPMSLAFSASNYVRASPEEFGTLNGVAPSIILSEDSSGTMREDSVPGAAGTNRDTSQS